LRSEFDDTEREVPVNVIGPAASNRLTVGRPTFLSVALHSLPWLAAMVAVFLGSFAHHGGLSISGGLSLLCFAAIVVPLVVQSDRVDLEPGAVRTRSWWSILQEKPGEEVALRPSSQLYRDSFGRVFVDHREVRLYLGLGWPQLAAWFERSGLSVFDDLADLETRRTLTEVALRSRWPIAILVYLTTLVVVWIAPDVFSVAVFGVGILLLTYYFVFHGRTLSGR
jgi:hypothetical protein